MVPQKEAGHTGKQSTSKGVGFFPKTGIIRDKIPLVYIGGCGHSGSMLLDVILGSHPAMISVGEINHYDPIGFKNETCRCSKKYGNCPLWQEVNQRFSGFLKQDGRDVQDNGLANLPYLWLGSILSLLGGARHIYDLHFLSPPDPNILD